MPRRVGFAMVRAEPKRPPASAAVADADLGVVARATGKGHALGEAIAKGGLRYIRDAARAGDLDHGLRESGPCREGPRQEDQGSEDAGSQGGDQPMGADHGRCIELGAVSG